VRARDLLDKVELLTECGIEDVLVEGITMNSREVRKNWAFVAIEGAHVNGHDFIVAALAAGASLIIGTREEYLSNAPSYVLVADGRLALAIMANNFFGRPGQQLRLVGITGTNGKTTTSYLLGTTLTALGKMAGVMGTIGAHLRDQRWKMAFTTPEAPALCKMLADMKDAGADVVAMEVSSHGLAMKRVDGLVFEVCVFTNLSQDHLDFHADMKSYGDTKARLFTEIMAASPSSKGAVINVDDVFGRELTKRLEGPVLTCSCKENGADITVHRFTQYLHGASFTVRGPWGDLAVRTPLVGQHNAANILAVLGVLHLLGEDVNEAASALSTGGTIPGRLEPVSNSLGLGIWVDYCHTPDALRNVLVALKEVVPGKLITVFGAGGDRDREKRPEMGRVVAEHSDIMVVTSDNPRTESSIAIIDEILSGVDSETRFKRTIVAPDRRLAIETALGIASQGDGVLIGGKGHELTQTIGKNVFDFDDRKVAAESVSRLERQVV
jgi:UDP-N-acetylmuramoyl-L-alanyl-D-glutamate--2,6-diaminopimelate ligase